MSNGSNNGSSDGSRDGSMTRAQRISLSLDRNLSVTAGAGTGKTRVLTSRFLKILGEGRKQDHLGVRGGAPPSRIVAVTFTRKAANEMRERVTKEITARVDAAIAAQDADEYRFWVQVRRDMDDATITTIHGLAARLVRMAALELQVDPKFRVVEGIDARLLLEEAVSVALSAPPQESLGPLRELYLLRGGKAVRDLMRALVGDRVHVDPWAKSLVENEAGAVLDAVWREFVPVDEAESRRLVQEVADVHAQILRNGEVPSTPPEPGSKAAILLDCLRSCAQSVEKDHRVRTTAVCLLLSLCTSKKGEWYKQPHYAMGKGADWKQMGCEGVDKDLFDALKGPLAPWAGRLTGVPGEQDERMMVLLRGIARLYLEVTRHYDQAKTRRGVLDYHDLEGHARRALRSPGVAEAIRRRIRYLLVDEFQDTNEDQWAILRALAVASDAAPEGWDDHGEPILPEEGAWTSVADRVQEEEGGPVGPSASGKTDPPPGEQTQKGMQSLQLTDVADAMDPEEEPLGEDRLFIVGDAKQSIYAFRGADVAVYQESRRKVQQANEYHGLDQEPLPEAEQKGPSIELEKRTREQGGEVALDRNFRSLPALVSFTNHFFDRLLAPNDPESPQTYEAEPGPLEGHRKRLVHDAQEPSPWAQGSVRLLLTPRELGRAVDRGDCTKTDADRLGPTRYQFLRMVQDIKDHASPDTRDPLLVADGKTDDDGVARGRPAQYRDVAVLLPRKRNLRILEEVLREQGVPYVVVAGRGFWSKQEVWDAVNLLSVVADPRRDVELLGVLRSPFFAWNDEALGWLAAAEGSSLWQRLVKIEKGETEGSPPSSFEGLPPAQVVAEVRRWRGLASTSGAARLLMDMLERTGYLASLRAREPESAGRLGVENLEKLVSLVRELESRRGRSIGPLVRDLLSLADEDAEEAEARLPGEEEVGVRVMTVHAAKGLQFPVCYVAETNGEMQTGAFQDARGVVFDRLGDQPFYALKARGLDGEVEKSFTYEALNKRALPREQAEQKRLLYVAATRAEDHLVFVGSSKRLGPREGQKAPALRPFAQGKCWLDWLEYTFGLDEGMHDDLVQEGERRRWFELGGPEGTETARVLVDVQAPSVARPRDPRARNEASAPGKAEGVGDEGAVEVVPALDLPSTQAVRVSPSQLSLYAECKARFRYGVLEGMSEGWVRGVQGGAPDYAASMGSMLHRALASGATEENPVPAPVLTRAKALARRWEGEGWPSPQQAEDHLTRHATRALATLEAQFGTGPVLSETDLDAEVAKGLRVVGRLDRVHRDRDGRLVVVDLKTDEVPKSEQETAKEHGHDVQVLLYDAALRQAGHETAPPGLLYSSTGRLLRVEPTPGELTVVEDLAERVAQSNEHARSSRTADGDPLDSIWPRDARDRRTCRGCGFWQGNQGPCPGTADPGS